MFGWIWGELGMARSPGAAPGMPLQRGERAVDTCLSHRSLDATRMPALTNPFHVWLNLCPLPDPSLVSVGFFCCLRMP